MKENEFVTLDDFLRGRTWPKTKNSMRYLMDKHKELMMDKGIIRKFDNLWFVSPGRFDEWVFKEKVR